MKPVEMVKEFGFGIEHMRILDIMALHKMTKLIRKRKKYPL